MAEIADTRSGYPVKPAKPIVAHAPRVNPTPTSTARTVARVLSGDGGPDEQRPEHHLGRDRQPEHGRERPDGRAVPPGQRDPECQQRRDVGVLERVHGRRPEQDDRVATDVPHADDCERAENRSQGQEDGDAGTDVDRKRSERRVRDRKLWRIHVRLVLLQHRIVGTWVRGASIEDGVRGREIREARVPPRRTEEDSEKRSDEDHGGGRQQDPGRHEPHTVGRRRDYDCLHAVDDLARSIRAGPQEHREEHKRDDRRHERLDAFRIPRLRTDPEQHRQQPERTRTADAGWPAGRAAATR